MKSSSVFDFNSNRAGIEAIKVRALHTDQKRSSKIVTIKAIPICTLLLLMQWLTLTNAAYAAPQTSGAVEVAGRSNQFGSIKFAISSTAINGVDTLGYMLWSQKNPNRTLSVNAENKSYVINPIKNGCLGIGYTTPRFTGLTKVVARQKCQLLGQDCVRYEGYTKEGGTLKPALEFYTLQKPPVAPTGLKAWCSLFLMPADYGFPVKITAINGNYWPHTFSPIRIQPINPKIVRNEVPSDFAYVEDRAAFYFGDGRSSKSSDISDFFRGAVK